MDEVDVRIFCEMAFKYPDYNRFSNRRISPTEIGRRLGISERTVRSRVKEMEEDQFIKYYQAVPNFSLFGMKELSSCMFETKSVISKRAVLERFLEAPRIVEILDFVGPMFAATIAANSSEEAKQVATGWAGKFELKLLPDSIDRKISEPLRLPDLLDMKIIQSLRYDAMRPIRGISSELSITYRMVEYRIERLLDSKVFFVVAAINPQRQSGLIFYGMSLFVRPPKQTAVLDELRKRHGHKLWLTRAPNDHTIIANLFGLTIGEPEDTFMRASGTEGVTGGFLVLNKDHLEPREPSWIDALIESKIDELTPKARS